MGLTKNDSYVRQIILYFRNKELNNAYSLAKEFNEKTPDDLISNFLLAKALFYLNRHEEALTVGRKAFNISHGQDLVTTAILLSSIYYMRGDFVGGYKLLESLESNKNIKVNGEVEELMTMLSLALNNPQQAMRHIDKLYQLNSKYAEDFILRFFE